MHKCFSALVRLCTKLLSLSTDQTGTSVASIKIGECQAIFSGNVCAAAGRGERNYKRCYNCSAYWSMFNNEQDFSKKHFSYILSILLFLIILIFFHFRGVIFYDEGYILNSALRVAHGEVPYRDFDVN